MSRVLPAALGITGTAAVMSILVPVAIWPGEAELTAPLFCSPAHSAPVVVSDTFHDSEGTSINYTLYCVGERGTATDEGFALPMLALFAAHLVLITTLVVLAGLWTLLRKNTSPSPVDAPP